jgi:hypothetical protein
VNEAFALLEFPGATLVRDENAPMLFAIWLQDEIVGAGDTREAAIAEARETLAEWGLA